jgi:two-component system sensor histidine kinase RegB
MAILAAELEQEYTDSGHDDLHRKLGILRKQVDRCKEALSVISASAGAGRAESGHLMLVRKYLDAVLAEWRQQYPHASLTVQISDQAPEAMIVAERTLTQALHNVLNNAADASPDAVTLDADWSAAELTITIADRGPGLREDIQEQLGKQPVTTKPEGLGVGLYLAHATIRRLGGDLGVSNRKQGGTTVRITMPLLGTAT